MHNISHFPNDITRYYLHYLNDQNVSNVRLVSTYFKEVIDKSTLFAPDARWLKEKLGNLINLQLQVIVSGEREIELKDKLKKKIKFFHYFGIESKEEKEVKKTLKKEVKKSRDDYFTLKLKLRLESKDFNKEYPTLKAHYKARIAFEMIKSIIGGEKKYEELPSFDVERVNNPFDIKKRVAIAKGIDILERKFVILGFSKDCRLVLLQQSKGSCVWSLLQKDGSNFNLIDNGMKITNKFTEITEFVKHQLEKRKEAFEKIMSLFGGWQQYEALPIMDLKKIEGSSKCTKIEPRMMSAPIMRGVDAVGRNFFTILVEAQCKVMYCRTIIEEPTHSISWITWNRSGSVAFVIDYCVVVENIFSKLAFLILKTKQKL